MPPQPNLQFFMFKFYAAAAKKKDSITLLQVYQFIIHGSLTVVLLTGY